MARFPLDTRVAQFHAHKSAWLVDIDAAMPARLEIARGAPRGALVPDGRHVSIDTKRDLALAACILAAPSAGKAPASP